MISALPPLNPHVKQLPSLALERYFRIFESKPDAIRMDIGEPSFSTEPHICQAAEALIQTGRIRYNPGLVELKQLIADDVASRTGVTYDAKTEVVLCKGAIGGLWNSIQVLAGPGDEVLVPDPCWPTLVQMIRMVGATPVFYPFASTEDRDNLIPNLENLISGQTRLMILLSPHNPTGLMLPKQGIENLARFVALHPMYVLSDDTYEQIVFDGSPFSPLSAEPDMRDRVVMVKTFSKTYCMTGWRIGAILGSAELIYEINKVNEVATGGVTIVSQMAAIAALRGSQDGVAERLQAYQERRDLFLAKLEAAGIAYTQPDGAFFTFIRLPEGADADRVVENMYARHAVAMMPGHVFGENGRGYLRASLTVEPEQIERGADALIDTLRSLGF